MSDMDRLQEGLRGLRDADANRGASGRVESRLHAEFRRHHRSRVGAWVSGAIAASISLAAIGWHLYTPKTEPAAEVPSAVIRPPERAVAELPESVSLPQPAARPKRTTKRPPAELEFVALPFAPPFHPDEDAQVIRVRVPRQSIRSMGLPVSEDRMGERVPADILVGYDGIARGIRFVTASEMR